MTPRDLGAFMTDDHTGALRHESEKVGAKIGAAYQKLATKLRGKADKARTAMETKKRQAKRALLQRRFELYADAAQDIEKRLAGRGEPQDCDSD